MKKAMNYLEWEEAQDLLADLAIAAKGTPYKARIAAGVAVLLHTGVTFGELKKLSWIDAQQPNVILRSFQLNPELSLAPHMAFQKYLAARFEDAGGEDENALIISANNPFFNRNLGREDINVGTLRRTFAHRAFDMGGGCYEMLLTLKMYFNHRSITRTTEMLGIEKPELMKPMRIFV